MNLHEKEQIDIISTPNLSHLYHLTTMLPTSDLIIDTLSDTKTQRSLLSSQHRSIRKYSNDTFRPKSFREQKVRRSNLNLNQMSDKPKMSQFSHPNHDVSIRKLYMKASAMEHMQQEVRTSKMKYENLVSKIQNSS